MHKKHTIVITKKIFSGVPFDTNISFNWLCILNDSHYNACVNSFFMIIKINNNSYHNYEKIIKFIKICI